MLFVLHQNNPSCVEASDNHLNITKNCKKNSLNLQIIILNVKLTLKVKYKQVATNQTNPTEAYLARSLLLLIVPLCQLLNLHMHPRHPTTYH